MAFSLAARSSARCRSSIALKLATRPISIATDVLDQRVAKLPNRDFLRVKHQEVRWSLKDFKKHSDAFMYGLASMGCRPGHVVAAWLGNEAETAVLIYAAARLGVVVAPFDAGMSRTSEIEAAMEATNCRVLLYSNDPGKNEVVNNVLPCLAQAVGLEVPQIRDDRFPELRCVVTTGYDKVNTGTMNFKHLLAYDVFGRDPSKRARPFVTETTPLIQPVTTMMGKPILSPAITHGDLVQKAAEAATEMDITNNDKIYMASSSTSDLAVSLAMACERVCPIVLPSPGTDEADLIKIEGCTKRMG